MANPRKFSEKIALHTHRQAEETAAFEKIMKEVSDVKVAPQAKTVSNTLRIGPTAQQLGAFRGGSLPDVSVPPRSNVGGGGTKSAATTKPNEEPPPPRLSSAGARQSRTRSPVGPIRTTRERKPSPYSSGPYLSPPSDTGWRRANSDSALHQSAMQGMGMDRLDPTQRVSWSMLPTMNGPDSRHPDGRPRSSCDIPRVPGIHIYPSAHDPSMAAQIPIGNNTGSLPDLTNMDFTSPIHAPLDQDQDNSSPYSSSPINTSPSTLSPTSMMPGVRNHNSRFNFTPPISQSVSNDKSIGPPENIDFSQIGAIYQQPGSPASPVQLPQMDNYRSSQRPSPQPSPTLGGRHSAPCSPGEPSPIPNDYHIHNQSIQFQQHFEQLTVGVDWAQLVASLMESGCTWTAQLESDPPLSQMSYGQDQSGAGSPQQQHHQMSHAQPIPGLPPDGKSDAGYYSTSPSQQLVYPSTSPGLHNTSPNTPTSLPEIILTDFSAGQDITRLDTPEFLTDDQLREGLGALDFAELQMLGGMSEIVEDYRS